MKGCNIIHLL